MRRRSPRIETTCHHSFLDWTRDEQNHQIEAVIHKDKVKMKKKEVTERGKNWRRNIYKT